MYNHATAFVDDWQSLYGSIYRLGQVKLETLKAYIKNNLANKFIRASKSPAKASILFNKKPNGSLRLRVNYWRLNNLIIKNQYLLLFVRKLLDQLVGRTQRFTQLYLTNTHHQMRIKEGDK